MNIIEITFAVALTITGSFFGFYLNRALEKRYLPKITSARQKAISGVWEGTYKQEDSEKRDEQNISFKLTLNAGSRTVTGLMSVVDTTNFEFHVEGSFYHNKYLRLNYTASGITEDAIDFGSIFLILGDYPNKMAGKLVGYGSISETLISGIIELNKT